jgi:hypothetical protein
MRDNLTRSRSETPWLISGEVCPKTTADSPWCVHHSLRGPGVSLILKFMPQLEMSDRESQVLQKAVSILTEELHPRRIILFGSRAEGRNVRASDFDLAVDANRPKKPWRSSTAFAAGTSHF